MRLIMLGDFVRVVGTRYEVEEMTRILRNTVLDGSYRAKVICKMSSAMSKMLKKDTNSIDDRFIFKGLSDHFKDIMKEFLPKSFYKIKYKELTGEPSNPEPFVIYNIRKGKGHELFIFELSDDCELEPVFQPKDYKDREFIKPVVQE